MYSWSLGEFEILVSLKKKKFHFTIGFHVKTFLGVVPSWIFGQEFFLGTF
jgi:hypothetical protein